MIGQLFKQEFVRRRMAANHLAIILDPFAVELEQRGYAPSGIRHHVLVAEHFGQWLRQQQVSLRGLSTFHVDQFLRAHLPRCRCATPAPKRRFRCQAALGQLVAFLRSQKNIRHPKTRTTPQGPTDQFLAAYDRHQNRVCGLSAETRRGQRGVARRFLKWRFGRQRPQWRQLQAKDIARFVGEQASRVGPVGLRHIVYDLRSFLRFLEFSGRVRSGLAGTVPQPP